MEKKGCVHGRKPDNERVGPRPGLVFHPCYRAASSENRLNLVRAPGAQVCAACTTSRPVCLLVVCHRPRVSSPYTVGRSIFSPSLVFFSSLFYFHPAIIIIIIILPLCHLNTSLLAREKGRNAFITRGPSERVRVCACVYICTCARPNVHDIRIIRRFELQRTVKTENDQRDADFPGTACARQEGTAFPAENER